MNKNNPLKKYDHIPISKLGDFQTYFYESPVPLRSVQTLEDQINISLSKSNKRIHPLDKVSVAKILISSSNSIAIVPSLVYNKNDPKYFYRFLEWHNKFQYGIASLKETENEPFYPDIISALENAIKQYRGSY